MSSIWSRTSLRAIGVALTLAPLLAAAQYKWVGPDGTVTYSDKPPPPEARVLGPGPVASVAPESADAVLPYALRTVSRRHPVVLYTTGDCEPCTQARGQLVQRGVPFAEKSVRTRADVDAFRALGFAETSFPILTVGRERSTGWEPGAWARLLDAAGYPKTSALPPGYRLAEAEPLAPPPEKVGAKFDAGAPGVPATAARAGASLPPPAPAGRSGSTIRF